MLKLGAVKLSLPPKYTVRRNKPHWFPAHVFCPGLCRHKVFQFSDQTDRQKELIANLSHPKFFPYCFVSRTTKCCCLGVSMREHLENICS